MAVLVASIIFLSGCTLPLVQPKKTALQVSSEPKTTVFLNDNHTGQTPYFDEQLKPGEYTLKLVPESQDGNKLLSWQGIIKLSPGIMTVVNRTLAETEDQSSGYILTMETTADKEKAQIAVISTPDSVVVTLDGEPKGFTPLVLDNITEGERLIKISSSGFKEETIKAKAIKGYKLLVNVQLAIKSEESGTGNKASNNEATASAQPSPKASPKASSKASAQPTASPKTSQKSIASKEPGIIPEKPYVQIKDTPTGFLKVRSEPSTAGGDTTVIVKVYPGETYKLVDENDNGWYKIEYETGKQGWISGQYATLYR